MSKYPFTQDGFTDFQAELFHFDEARLLHEAIAVAEDSCSYVAHRFELDVFQLEALRTLGDKELKLLGWCFALAMVNRRQFTTTKGRVEGSFAICSLIRHITINCCGSLRIGFRMPDQQELAAQDNDK